MNCKISFLILLFLIQILKKVSENLCRTYLMKYIARYILYKFAQGDVKREETVIMSHLTMKEYCNIKDKIVQ